jgi:phosphocarrier protein HPr
MVSQKVIVRAADGLHMRSAMALSDGLRAFESDVAVLCHGDSVVDAKSILEMIAACIRCGDEVEIVATGPDERAALDAALRAVESSADCCLA